MKKTTAKVRPVNFKKDIHNLLKFQSTITGETLTDIAERAFMESLPEDILKQYIALFGLSEDSEILKYIDKDGYKNEAAKINSQITESVKEEKSETEEILEEKKEVIKETPTEEIHSETSDIATTSEDELEIDDELSCYF